MSLIAWLRDISGQHDVSTSPDVTLEKWIVIGSLLWCIALRRRDYMINATDEN